MLKKEFLDRVEEARANGQKVGLVQGSWDLFHLGHLRYILKARDLCDFLIISMDSDEKIKKRKGNSRPIIPEDERYEFIRLLNIADEIVIKELDEPKWHLIKTVRPDVLIAIKENYRDEEIEALKEYCGKISILPRQSESSTSDKIRKIMISGKGKQYKEVNEKVEEAVTAMKERINYNEDAPEPIQVLMNHVAESTDWKCPTAAACFKNGNWYYGVNISDFNIPKEDLETRSELYYATVEHAEINLLKKLDDASLTDVPIYTTLFPCDKCLKVLINKGVKEIYYLEDHEQRNWSKRSHELAKKHHIKVTKLIESKEKNTKKIDMNSFKYIYPANARCQEQLDIMINLEREDKDPMEPKYLGQKILFETEYWYVSENRFPYEGVAHQFLIGSLKPVYKREDVSQKMWLDLQKIWDTLCDKYHLSGGALCCRFGAPFQSGASLKRFHVHLIVPKEGEKAKFNIGGRKELREGLEIKELQKN